jgi:Cof subfamily protein (haloacid dehalogenase superfamily)
MDRPAPAARDLAAVLAASDPVRLVALDVDGTLTTSRHEITPAVRAAVSRALSRGLEVVLATGRRYRDVLGIAVELGITRPLVTASGALVKEPRTHRTLARSRFADTVLPAVLATIVDSGHEAVVYTDSFAEGFDFLWRGTERPGAGLAEYLDWNRHLARTAPDLLENPPADIFAGFAFGSRPAMLALEERLLERFGRNVSVHVIRSPRYRDWLCEVAPGGVTKWSGVAAIAERLGVPAGAICAVGDDMNDLPMLAAAGIGVAMANAVEPVLRAARAVAPSNDEDGLATLLDMLAG